MMAYVPVPKDLTRVKSKLVFNLTKRQIICFSLGALAGVPLFFLTKGAVGTSVASLLMITAMIPFFMFAMYERHGQPRHPLCEGGDKSLALTSWLKEVALRAESGDRNVDLSLIHI